MNRTKSQVYWTSDAFVNLTEKLVNVRNFTENFKEAISKLDEKTVLNRKDGCKLLEYLFENSKIKEFYDSAEELMHNLEEIQNFPNNSKFLGFCHDELNYLATRYEMKNQEGIRFCSKIEAFQSFYKTRMISWQTYLIAKSFGNRLARKMNNSFELIPIDLFEERINFEVLKYTSNFEKIKKIPENINNIDDFYGLLKELYDKTYDEKLLEELKEILKKENVTNSFTVDSQKYLDFYNSQIMWKNALEISFGIFESSSHWFQRKYPVLRVFELENDRFIMSKELENVLEVVMINKTIPRGIIQSETAEQRQLGIVKSIEFHDFETILKILKVSISDIHIINYKVCETSSNDTPIPINTPFGTYSTLAKHSFWNIFQQIIREIGPVANYNLIFEWFSQFSDIFNDSLKHRYFIETWKTEEIMKKAYKEIIGKIPTIKNGKLENLDVIKNRFLEQNPKFIHFIIHQNYCLRPGRFFDLSQKVKKIVNDEPFIVHHRRAFMAILPKIPTDSWIPRPVYEKLIDQELNLSNVVLDTRQNLDFMKMVQLEGEYLEFQGPPTNQMVRRKKVPQKSPFLNGPGMETYSKAIFSAMQKGDYSKTEGTKENIEKFMKNDVMKELSNNGEPSDEMLKILMQMMNNQK